MEEGAVRVNEDFPVDLFTLMRSRTFADFAATARRLEIDEVVVRYFASESLIELKSASAREKRPARSGRAPRNHCRRSAARLCESRGTDAADRLDTG